MNFSAPEDAASLLEQFVHDVANAPAEITHLLEEIAAKDHQISLFKDEMQKRDVQLQKWVRLNGGHVLNPKDEAFSKTISDCYDKCEILQAEKCGLGEKALIVLERQIRRMDVGLRSLATREEFPSDWGGPSMLSTAGTGTSTPNASGAAATSGATAGALQPVSGNAVTTGGAPNIANAAQMRLAQTSAGARGASGTQTPTTAPRSQRESSSEANKRRRLNASLGTLPAASSHLRQSSLGPGTPKAGTPGPATSSSRAGSAQPSRPSGVGAQKKAPSTSSSTNRKPAPPQNASSRNSKRSRPSAVSTKTSKDRRRALARTRDGTPTTASLSPTSSRSTSPTPSSLPRNQNDGTGDTAMSEDEEGVEEDSTLYCFCQKVSFGDMVGCDNDDCKYQWFHWGCVGLKSEPEGEWLCPECRKNAPGK